MNSETESEIPLDNVASKINAFKRARDMEQIEFDVYVYRSITDSNKKKHNPFLHKYENYLPDELEIAEKFRGGRYKLQAIWYEGKSQKSESWHYEIDEVSFPAVDPVRIPMVNGSTPGDMTQNMMFMVADILKTAYSRPVVETEPQRDPIDMFGEVSSRMQEMYSRILDMQTSVMERSMQMKIEKSFGLIGDGSEEKPAEDEGEKGFMENGVIEIVKQIVDAAKLILPMLNLPGAKPVVESIKQNPMFSKYIDLAKNPAVVSEVAGALRKEYGDKKAALLLSSFGIKMMPRPGAAVPTAVVTQSRVPAGKSESRPGTKKIDSINNKKISTVKKG